MPSLNESVIAAAREQGFVLAGFAALGRLDEREEFYRRWLAGKHHATMAYLAREPERRFDPRRLDRRYRSVVSLGWPYAAPVIPKIDWRAEMRGRIAAYALGRDYHDVVLKRARAVGDAIKRMRPGAVTRSYVDTGPIFEREWAAAAGLGWFGKNTMMLNRKHGSYFFLAEIFTSLELEPSAAPDRDHCGTCQRCLDLCPTGALGGGYVMESRLCISYLTIENRGAIPRELRPKLGNWIFGCDICNEVCPWNEPSVSETYPHDLMPYLPELLALDDAGFSRRFTVSAIKRTKRRGLLRNAAVALGNSGNPAAIPALARSLAEEREPIVRAHAAWALGQIGTADARRALERSRTRDPDPSVRAEIAAAIAGTN
jgi:epoxyqueuosine reductase